MKLFARPSKPLSVEFCDRCGSVCDAACRAASLRRRSVDRALAARFGVR